MKTRVCLPSELGAADLARWREIVASRPDFSSPFLSPVFALAVGRSRPAARIGVIEDGSRVVGYFPFERRRFGLGVALGAGLSDWQAIVCEADTGIDPLGVLADCGLSSWRFDHLVATQADLIDRRLDEIDSPIVDLSRGWEAYLAAGCRREKKAFQHERKLAREVGPTRVGIDVVDPQALDRMFAWKSAQYKRTGRPDRFAVPATVQLVRDLAATREPDLTGTLITLHAGDCLVAVELNLRSGPVLAGWFPGYAPEYAKYSCGAIRTLRTLEAMPGLGMTRFDFGKGEEVYKGWLKTGDHKVLDGWLVGRGLLGPARRAASRPREMVFETVLRHQRLRLAARATLKGIGSLRMAVTRRRDAPVECGPSAEDELR